MKCNRDRPDQKDLFHPYTRQAWIQSGPTTNASLLSSVRETTGTTSGYFETTSVFNELEVERNFTYPAFPSLAPATARSAAPGNLELPAATVTTPRLYLLLSE
jgi:hypothetical protein